MTLGLGLVLALLGTSDVMWHTLAGDGHAPLDYVIVTPDGYDPDVAYPVLVALPPGGGGRDMVDRGLELYFAEEADRRGWVVVSPTAPQAPDDGADSPEGEAWAAALFDAVAAEVVVEGGTFHLAGVSNGGRRAFRVAAHHPQRLASLTALPGVPSQEAGSEQLMAIATLPTALFVGEQDAGWLEASRATEQKLRAVGAARLSLDVLPGEGHVLDASLATRIFDRLEGLREDARRQAAVREEVSAVLDTLHHAAAVADEERYFDCFLPEAIFVGTDATERWTLAQLRTYAAEPFQSESAWVYEMLERHVVPTADRASDGPAAYTTARFDERLMNEKYGETRGSGVLRLRDGRWRIEHYVLSFAVPNERAPAVFEAIAGGER